MFSNISCAEFLGQVANPTDNMRWLLTKKSDCEPADGGNYVLEHVMFASLDFSASSFRYWIIAPRGRTRSQQCQRDHPNKCRVAELSQRCTERGRVVLERVRLEVSGMTLQSAPPDRWITPAIRSSGSSRRVAAGETLFHRND